MIGNHKQCQIKILAVEIPGRNQSLVVKIISVP